TIDPPLSCRCMTALARCETCSMPRRFREMIFSLNFGDASAVNAYGEPPALLTTTSSRPCLSTTASTRRATESGSRTSHSRKSYGRPSTGWRAHVTTVAPWSAKTLLIPAPTPRTPPVTRTTRPASPKFRPSPSPLPVTVLAYQASACFPNLARKSYDHHVNNRRTGHRRRHGRLSAGQRHSVPRLVRAGRCHHRYRRKHRHACGDPSRRRPRLQRRRRHQGDAELRGLHCADRREPRVLRRVPRGVRMRGPGGRGSERILRRRWHRARR